MAKEITSLLLNFNGANNSTTFTDELGQTVTPYGDIKISTTQSKFGGSSAYFDGTGDYLEVTKSNNERAWDFSTTDWTLECWVYPLDTASRAIFEPRNPTHSAILLFTNGGKFAGYASSGAGWNISIIGATSYSANQWYHLAFVKYGNLFILFVNGQVDGTGTYSGALMSLPNPLLIGKDSGNFQANWYGYIDSFKLTSGRALYTESFTLPTEEPQYDPYYEYVELLLPFNGPNNSTVFGDYSLNRNIVTSYGDVKISTTQSKFGGSSAYFDGTTDCLKVGPSSNFTFGTGNFTIEFYIYIVARSHTSVLYDGRDTTTNTNRICIFDDYQSTGKFVLFNNMAATRPIQSSTTPPIGQWTHFALCRSLGQTKMFINGVKEGSTYSDSTDYQDVNVGIGASALTGDNLLYSLNGYIDELRVTKGIARYTTNFTPPDKAHYVPYNYDPFLDKVSFLCHMNGDNDGTIFVDSSINAVTITPAGNAKTVTTLSKIGGSSAYFDGTGDYLSTLDFSGVVFGTEDFTIECFIKTATNSKTIIDRYSASSSTWQLLIDSSGYLQWYTSTPFKTGSVVVTDNNWHHIAVVKKSNALHFYIDGVEDGTGTTDNNNYSVSVTFFSIGGQVNSRNASYDFNGFINAIRITKGLARYVTDFTSPNQRFYDLLIEYFYGTYSDFLRIAPGETLGVINTVDKQYPIPFRDMEDSGTYRIFGTVPGSKIWRILLIDKQSNRIFRATYSELVTGYFEFLQIPYKIKGFTVMAVDPNPTPDNALIADLVTSGPML